MKTDEVVVETAAGRRVDDATIDEDPWALLPSGAISWMGLDAQALYASKFGSQVSALLGRTLPLATNAGVDFTRDVDALSLGIYSLSGVDVAGVATGRFSPQLIDQAVVPGALTSTGRPITRSVYAGRTLYVADGVGMTVLTPKTLVFGNEIGMRRVLDRIEEGRVDRKLPAWFEELLATQNAPMAWGVDLAENPLSDAARHQVSFLQGLRAARLLGNFQEPGLNLAGSLTYGDEATAVRGAETLRATVDTIRSYGFLMAIFGVSQPITRVEAQARGREVALVTEMDGQAIGGLLANADRVLGMLLPAGR